MDMLGTLGSLISGGNINRDDMSRGLSDAFRSDQTPPFPQMLGSLFGNSNPNIKATVLNQLIAVAGPSVLQMIMQRYGHQSLPHGQVTPEQADQIPPAAVEEMAEQAHQQNPGIVDQLSNIYAEHPTLINSLGAAAAAIAMKHLAGEKRGIF
jgi:hypothetical protein